jgi:hypothetical protein
MARRALRVAMRNGAAVCGRLGARERRASRRGRALPRRPERARQRRARPLAAGARDVAVTYRGQRRACAPGMPRATFPATVVRARQPTGCSSVRSPPPLGRATPPDVAHSMPAVPRRHRPRGRPRNPFRRRRLAYQHPTPYPRVRRREVPRAAARHLTGVPTPHPLRRAAGAPPLRRRGVLRGFRRCVRRVVVSV